MLNYLGKFKYWGEFCERVYPDKNIFFANTASTSSYSFCALSSLCLVKGVLLWQEGASFGSSASLIEESKSSWNGLWRLIEAYSDWIFQHISTKYPLLLFRKFVGFRRNPPVFTPYWPPFRGKFEGKLRKFRGHFSHMCPTHVPLVSHSCPTEGRWKGIEKTEKRRTHPVERISNEWKMDKEWIWNKRQRGDYNPKNTSWARKKQGCARKL